MAEVTWEPLCLHTRGRPRRISRQKFPKRTRILSIPSKPYSFHSVHSAIGSRMNGMIFRSFRKRNSSQKNTNTVYSEYSYSGIVPKERTQRLSSEPDNKQTYRPVQPREFVCFDFNDLTLVNLKKACADHFNVPTGSVDVLVSNKGPSATNVNQIPHRKDKVSSPISFVYKCGAI